jgi:SAM-dependent methyltransferase
LLEFTGERVIPGLVDPNLLNEHLARYRFAAFFAARFGGRQTILDAGCGSGYGTVELGPAASIVALDLSADAVTHASHTFSRPGVHFLQGTCEALPFADGSFDLLVAFEVIEHIEGWREMLAEARRVLRPAGILLVSTPNRAYYAESRAAAGPNPYHVHEFEYLEFESALKAEFPHVHLWSQNRSEAMVFVPLSSSCGVLDALGDAAPGHAHFFLAACSRSPIPETRAFAWMPVTGNLLRERERHIELLQSEIEQKNLWLGQAQRDQSTLQSNHESLLVELAESNAWAGRLDTELTHARATIAQLQNEIPALQARYQEQISRLEAEGVSRLSWVRDLESQVAGGRETIDHLQAEAVTRLVWVRDLQSQIASQSDQIDRLKRQNEDYENTIAERTQWAQSLNAELQREKAELQREKAELERVNAELQRFEAGVLTIGASKWVRLGRRLGLGPDVEGWRRRLE